MFSYQLPYKICDPVHGFIRFDEIEKKVINAPFYQRLRFIMQMGVAFLVYPGATHSRFEHCLGVMDLATRIYETLMAKHNLFFADMVPSDIEERNYWRRILRIAALCHDLGHLPFSHTAESDLFPVGGHELMTFRIVQSEQMRKIWQEIPSNGRNVEEDILKLAVSEEELKAFDPKIQLTSWEKVLSQVITEDNFGADRMDYLIRDAEHTGVGYGHFDYHQLVDTLRILPNLKKLSDSPLTIGVSKSGLQSVESLWIARYLMSARVYQHSKCRIYSYHMSRFITRHYGRLGFPLDLEKYLHENDGTIITALYKGRQENDYDALALLKEVEGFREIPLEKDKVARAIERKEELEQKFKGKIFIDYIPEVIEKESFRQFPVLSDGHVILSSEASFFLKDIPLTNSHISLFAHPDYITPIEQSLL